MIQTGVWECPKDMIEGRRKQDILGISWLSRMSVTSEVVRVNEVVIGKTIWISIAARLCTLKFSEKSACPQVETIIYLSPFLILGF